MLNHHMIVNYLRFWHSLVLQKENTGTHKEKGQQSMSKRLLVLNYIHYRTLSQKATKKLSHSLREDGRRAHHVCLKCKLFQVKEDLCLLLDPKHTAPVLQKAKCCHYQLKAQQKELHEAETTLPVFTAKIFLAGFYKGYDLTKHSSVHINNLDSFSPLSSKHTEHKTIAFSTPATNTWLQKEKIS